VQFSIIAYFCVILSFYYILKLEELSLAILWGGIIGFFNTPTLPLLIEFGVEVSFPVGDAMPVGIMLGFG